MKPLIAPVEVRLEASSRCQLRCPSCPTTSKAIDPVVGSGVLKLTDFRDFLAANPRVRKIEISNYGEVFLNPELLDILKLAHEKNVAISIANGANLNHVAEPVLEALVKYRVESITCSIDGASQETYAQYRVRGNYDRVMENVRRINRFKAQYRSDRPHLAWQFIVFGHNEHEIGRAQEIAREMNMEIRFKLSWNSKFSPLRDAARVLEQTGLPAATREEYTEQTGSDYMASLCRQLWQQPQINWDGKNLGCCRNFWGDFGGNAFRDGLLKLANHEKMNHARAMLQGERPPRDDIPCTTCSIYQQMRTSGQWLQAPAPSRIFVTKPLRKAKLIIRDKLRRVWARHTRARPAARLSA